MLNILTFGMINIVKMTLEQRALQAAERMTEFYTQTEFEQYITHCTSNGIHAYDGMLFLDGQTRMNYWVNQEEPKIVDYMIDVYNHFKGGDKQ